MISLEEQISGWYRLLRQAKQPDDLARTYQSLIDTVVFLARLPILPFRSAAITHYKQLLGMKLNVGRMDLSNCRHRSGIRRNPGYAQHARLCPCAWIDHRRLVGLVMRIRMLVAKIDIDLLVARPRGFSKRNGVLQQSG